LPAGAQASEEAEAIQPVAFTPRIQKQAQPVRYTVRRGDSLHAIAQRFDIGLADIKAWNPAFRKSSRIHAGQKVVIRKP